MSRCYQGSKPKVVLMLDQCRRRWKTLKQHWINALRLLGMQVTYFTISAVQSMLHIYHLMYPTITAMRVYMFLTNQNAEI